MAYVYQAGTGKYREVKNLGWLLKHHAEVTEVRVYCSEYGAMMHVELTGNRLYMIAWASKEVCRDWLKRPTFQEKPTRFIPAKPLP